MNGTTRTFLRMDPDQVGRNEKSQTNIYERNEHDESFDVPIRETERICQSKLRFVLTAAITEANSFIRLHSLDFDSLKLNFVD